MASVIKLNKDNLSIFGLQTIQINAGSFVLSDYLDIKIINPLNNNIIPEVSTKYSVLKLNKYDLSTLGLQQIQVNGYSFVLSDYLDIKTSLIKLNKYNFSLFGLQSFEFSGESFVLSDYLDVAMSLIKLNKNNLSFINDVMVQISGDSFMLSSNLDSVNKWENNIPFVIKISQNQIPIIKEESFYTVVRDKVDLTSNGLYDSRIMYENKDEGKEGYVNSYPYQPRHIPNGFIELKEE